MSCTIFTAIKLSSRRKQHLWKKHVLRWQPRVLRLREGRDGAPPLQSRTRLPGFVLYLEPLLVDGVGVVVVVVGEKRRLCGCGGGRGWGGCIPFRWMFRENPTPLRQHGRSYKANTTESFKATDRLDAPTCQHTLGLSYCRQRDRSVEEWWWLKG